MADREKGRGAEYNLRMLWSLGRWLVERAPEGSIAKVAAAGRIAPGDLDGKTFWVAPEAFFAILEAAREVAGDDEAFQRACVHRFEESYGYFRHVVWALAPEQLYRAVAKNAHMVARSARVEVVSRSSSSLRVRFHTPVAEPRVACLLRQAQWRAGPTMWGLPAATLEEHGCIAEGAPCCEYALHWQERRRSPTIAAAGLGLALAVLAVRLLDWPALAAASLPAVLGLAAYARENARVQRQVVAASTQLTDAVRGAMREEGEVRLELQRLHDRQQQWTRMLEEQLEERSRVIEGVSAELGRELEDRATTIRGMSHDLKNPVFAIQGNAHLLLSQTQDESARAILSDIEAAAARLDTLIGEMLSASSRLQVPPRLRHEQLSTAELARSIRGRLRAFVFGRDIRVSVFSAREAPESVECDPVLLDRVIDNLLSNAAKYTSEGSILVELSGSPGETLDDPPYLTLKVSDTGVGIERESLRRIFDRPPTTARSLPPAAGGAATSHGIGLSVVTRILNSLDGRLEIMSRPGGGTTVWAHVPSRMKTAEEARESGARTIVRIREQDSA